MSEPNLFGPDVIRTATMSPCGHYRYRLRRTWGGDGPTACFIMLNPSTADHVRDDPTIRRCVGFARNWGCGGLVVVNLFAWRATDPHELFDVFYCRHYPRPDGSPAFHNGDPVGPENDAHILAAVAAASPVVAAWGAQGVMMNRAEAVGHLLAGAGVAPLCLGKTTWGQPRHPLYVASATPLSPLADAPLVTGEKT
jgi:hypothetical protein